MSQPDQWLSQYFSHLKLWSKWVVILNFSDQILVWFLSPHCYASVFHPFVLVISVIFKGCCWCWWQLVVISLCSYYIALGTFQHNGITGIFTTAIFFTTNIFKAQISLAFVRFQLKWATILIWNNTIYHAIYLPTVCFWAQYILPS